MNIPSIAIEQADRGNAGDHGSAHGLGMLFVSLFALLLSSIAAADGTPRDQFAVWAIGLPNGYVIMEHQAPTVQVTTDDVARGAIDVDNGTRIVITTIEPSGAAVEFRSSSKLFSAVRIDGIGSSVHLGRVGGTIVETQAAIGRRVVTVNYRFTLAPDTAPGTYAWPLAMVVRAPAPRNFTLLAEARQPRDHVVADRYASQ
jgi:hypothetical protein